MRMRRPVLEKLTEIERAGGLRQSGSPRAWWPNPEDERMNPGHSVARIVERGWPREIGIPEECYPGNDYQSGDYMMCLKARAAGFRVFVDPDMKFHHAGAKVWTGHFGNHLRREQCVFNPSFLEAVEALEGWYAYANGFSAAVRGLGHQSPAAACLGIPGRWRPRRCRAFMRRRARPLLPCWRWGRASRRWCWGWRCRAPGRSCTVLECHLESWRHTAQALDRLGIKNVVLHYAPLVPVGPGVNEVAYGAADLPDEFGLVLVDGPYHSPQRKTALWMLREKIRTATLVIDDVDTCGDLLEMIRNAGHALDVRDGRQEAMGDCRAEDAGGAGAAHTAGAVDRVSHIASAALPDAQAGAG